MVVFVREGESDGCEDVESRRCWEGSVMRGVDRLCEYGSKPRALSAIEAREQCLPAGIHCIHVQGGGS